MFDNIRNFFKKTFNSVDEFYKDNKLKVSFLEENNLSTAYGFFETGDITECINRLKIMGRLWPNNENAKYLLAVSYILYRDCPRACDILENIKEFKIENVEKLKKLAKQNKSKKIIEAYINGNFTLTGIEDELQKIDL